MHIHLLAFLLLQTIHAQPTPCTFSCPPADELGQTLLKHTLAVPYESDYSVFECVYGEVNPNPRTHSCFYTKSDGKQAVGGQTDNCPTEAATCSDGATAFSSTGKPEVPAWIENGRWLLYLSENHT